jgi:4-methyl-5(b-hydroxyethyl)-thiazole monophosphate biosynthesis
MDKNDSLPVGHFFLPDDALYLMKNQIIMKKKIAVHLADGFEEIEAVTIIDVLRRAELDLLVVSVSGNLEVAGAHQLKLIADLLFDQVNYEDIFMIVLPGGMPGAANLNVHAGLKLQIGQFNAQNKYLAAICAAPMVYGNMGILAGKQVVCYPGFEKYLIGAEILNSPVVESENMITGRGPAAAIQFALKIVEKAVSLEKAELVARQMLVE